MGARKWFVVPALLALSTTGYAQGQQQASEAIPPATTTCQSTFTSGSGQTLLKFCTTSNGNVVQFQSPAGYEHLREGSFLEGYSICDFSSSLIRYEDYAATATTNWGTSVITQPHGPNTFPLTITRTTSDGHFTLTQVFTRVSGDVIVKVKMTLKNNTATSKDYALVRFADVDANNANGGTFNNTFDFDHESAWGYNAGFNLYGLMIMTVPTNTPHFAVAQKVASGIDPCDPVANYIGGSPFFGDGSVGIDWNGTLGPGKSVTVTGEYRRF